MFLSPRALLKWSALERLERLKAKALVIAAENDFTPLAEKQELAKKLKAELVVVRGSRHGTPFDSVEATNASLLAMLTDQPLPPPARWVRDTPTHTQAQAPVPVVSAPVESSSGGSGP